MQKLKTSALFFLLFNCFTIACEKKASQTIEYSIQDIDLVLEGPVFEGSNDFQAKVSFNPDQLLQASGLQRDRIKDIRVKNLSLKAESNFDLFESLVVQLTSEGSPLTSIGLLNPVPVSQNNLSPEVNSKVSFKAFKNSDSFYLVMDAIVKGGYEDDIRLKGDIIFTIDLK